jgi:hypothetical protein
MGNRLPHWGPRRHSVRLTKIAPRPHTNRGTIRLVPYPAIGPGISATQTVTLSAGLSTPLERSRTLAHRSTDERSICHDGAHDKHLAIDYASAWSGCLQSMPVIGGQLEMSSC